MDKIGWNIDLCLRRHRAGFLYSYPIHSGKSTVITPKGGGDITCNQENVLW